MPSASNRFIKSLRLRNFLSFGDEALELECEPLNVLIGPNASGKSNLIESLGVLHAVPDDLPAYLRAGGGVLQYLRGPQPISDAEIEVVLNSPQHDVSGGLRYRIAFGIVGQRTRIADEFLENCAAPPGENDVYFYYRYQNGRPVLNTFQEDGSRRRRLEPAQSLEFDISQSVLAQFRDPVGFPEITFVARHFEAMRLYREWDFGRESKPRYPQKPDNPNDFLLEDASNLVLVLNRVQTQHGEPADRIEEYLNRFYEGFDRFSASLEEGSVQLSFRERNGGSITIPGTRLSDGTLRFTALLSVLLHPKPPAVIAIEEPEIGLHPDMIATVAELLKDASTRCQLFVTTHSDALVTALSDTPESVVVCEKHEGSTRMRRLERDSLKEWLGKYSLGELWSSGELGGNRW